MQAHRYDAMFAMIKTGKLAPHRLVGKTISLAAAIPALMNMDRFENKGVTVVTEF
jgi:alcohol dehydrogenase